MAKRRKPQRREREKSPTVTYTDPDGNVLELREQLSASTIAKIGEPPASRAAPLEDAWARREEALFERLTVSWVISDLPIDEQKMLIGRYRMADSGEKQWVRETIDHPVERFMPELD